MAWMDDRMWCHPKFVNLTDGAFRLYWNAVAYSSGMGTRGVLTSKEQQTIGATSRAKGKLLASRLWERLDDKGAIKIHDWDSHNGRRDDRREADRERKREARAKEREAATNGRPQDSPQERPQDKSADKHADKHADKTADAPRVRPRGSDGSEGREEEHALGTSPVLLNPPLPLNPRPPARTGKYTEAEMQASFALSRQRVADERAEREREGNHTKEDLQPINPAAILEPLHGDAA